MTLRERMWISLRHMKSGIVGVLLVILATSVGIALAASTAAFIRAYRIQTKQLLNNPVYREVNVQVLGLGEAEFDTPVVEIEAEKIRSGLLYMSTVAEAVESVPAVDYAYTLDRFTIQTTASLMKLEESKSRKRSSGGESKEDDADEEVDAKRELKPERSLVELPLDQFPVVRTTNDFFTAYGIAAEEGFLFTREDLEAGNPMIVLGSELTETLFPSGGAVGARVSLWYQTFTVSGILEPTSYTHPDDQMPYNRMAFLPAVVMEKAWGKRSFVSNIRFAATDSVDIQPAVLQLTSYFANSHPDTNVMITASIDELMRERRTLSRVIAVLVFLTAVGLFIAAINLFNLMLIRIVKHTKGIGIMRALGWTESDIFRQFMNESILMCLTGAAIGTAVSPLVFRLLHNTIVSGEGFATQTFGLDLIIGAAAGLVFSLLFGLYPAYLAKNTDASTAVRSE